ncbi:hypothetical protein CVT24_009559 [Panaeolus cyanescens]|uniref:F-box domain-containing protein n=1 Tax=Panaeolus cyanescens TaxID=181874 RepID=A0A409YAG2_9AGAR|nr:hypothetical protein CVT24_009559 [Panaeolus cyanescens]
MLTVFLYTKGIAKPLTSDDVARLKLFGSRVHSLGSFYDPYDYSSDPVIDPAALLVINSALQGSPLLPNLQYLSLELPSTDSPNDLCILPLLCSPHLRQLSLTNSAERDWTAAIHDVSLFVQHLAQAAALRDLLIDIPINQYALDSISSLTDLHSLIITPDDNASIDNHFFSSMSKFDSLDTLDLSCAQILWKQTSRSQKLHFHKLTVLRLKINFEDALTLFSIISSTSLVEVEYRFILPADPPYPFRWSRLFDLIKTTSNSVNTLILKPSSSVHVEDPVVTARFRKLYSGIPFSELSSSLLELITPGHRFPALLFPLPRRSSKNGHSLAHDE